MIQNIFVKRKTGCVKFQETSCHLSLSGRDKKGPIKSDHHQVLQKLHGLTLHSDGEFDGEELGKDEGESLG